MHTPLPLPLLPDHGSLCAGRCCVRDRGDSANGRVRGRHVGRSGKQGNASTGNSFITENMSSMKKHNTSHFYTLNRLHVQATHPGLCSAATALLSAWMVQETGKAGKDLEIGKFFREKNLFLPGDPWAHHLLPVCKRRSHIARVAGRLLLSLVAQHWGSIAGTAAAPLVGAALWVTFSVRMTVAVPKRPLGFCSPPSPAFHPLGYVKLLLVVQLSTSAYKVLQELKYSS